MHLLTIVQDNHMLLMRSPMRTCLSSPSVLWRNGLAGGLHCLPYCGRPAAWSGALESAGHGEHQSATTGLVQDVLELVKVQDTVSVSLQPQA